MILEINKKNYKISKNEFEKIYIEKYCNLKIFPMIGIYERISSLLIELGKLNIEDLLFIYPTHGGFPIIECSPFFKNIYILNVSYENRNNILENLKNHSINNVFFIDELNKSFNLCYCENIYFPFEHSTMPKILLTLTEFEKNSMSKIYTNIYELSNSNLSLFLNSYYINDFIKEFYYFIDSNNENKLYYDNLINLCIMVKNGGEQFKNMLIENLPVIDRWTILDTGSTDNTIKYINEILVGKKKGNLYQEPFIDFKTSRNRCLELAGKDCKFTLMLDDTYIIRGNLRKFLNTVRGDQFSDSFSLYIKSDDLEYVTNRILKTDRELRYLFKIHEVITDKNNVNVVIPIDDCFIDDTRHDYMEIRTQNRKEYDLKMLLEEINEDPMNPRHYYYIAQTYNLLGKYEEALDYFLKRINLPIDGFIQEKFDACFEAARIANFKLNKPWEYCENLYKKSIEISNETRPEPFYFIGIHYLMISSPKNSLVYLNFKKAFEIGYPLHLQYSLKPSLSHYFLPKFLTEVSYSFNDYDLGLKACELFLSKNQNNVEDYNLIVNWYRIFLKLKTLVMKEPNIPDKPYLCFVADGGWGPWLGSDIQTKGVGGSETYIIEMARYIQKNGYFQVLVFCNCPHEEVFEGVQYLHLNDYGKFIGENLVHTSIISRYNEYIPMTCKSHVENVYVVFHDLIYDKSIIPNDKKIKKIFCLSEWHKKSFDEIFSNFSNISVPFYYGVDINNFENKNNLVKNKYNFIYSSFPNRGLLPLLLMWPSILKRYPSATLSIYCDLEGEWVNRVEPLMMRQIKEIIEKYIQGYNISYFGWVDKKTLSNAWLQADIWFYPCIFKETFCLTALEAAISKTLAITSNLAALQNTVGDRGILIDGDPKTELWKNKALFELFEVIENEDLKNSYIERNYEWAKKLTWENQANEMIKTHLIPENLEYRNMYGWFFDVPNREEKFAILKSINQFNEKNNGRNTRILEVGTYTGTSLIKFIELIPNSYGVGIDSWENYSENIYSNINIDVDVLSNIKTYKIEESFYRNIKNTNLENRIEGRKGKSSDLLMEMIKREEKFDFIYVDGSHRCIQTYVDLLLSWNILNKNGIIIIDDYTYNNDEVDILKIPKKGVDTFLNEYKDDMDILFIGYRVILEKKV